MNRTGIVLVLLTILTAELVKRQGLSPIKTLGGAAAGTLVLK